METADKSKQLILETDGSDDGWGAILLQQDGDKREVIGMWSGQWKTVAMRKAPPYYKETKAWMMGLEKAHVYADAHPLPIKCVTDHIPLTWIKNTSGKGPVSQFVLDNLSKLDYEIVYRPGNLLVQADAVSRYPCLGPRVLSDEGKMAALETLFEALPDQWKLQGRTWIYTGKDTKLARESMAQYQTKIKAADRVPMTDNPTPTKVAKLTYEFAVFAPYAENVTKVLDAALSKDKPFACLIPISLVDKAPSNKENANKLRAAAKLVLLDPEMVWIMHNVPNVTSHQVYAREIHRWDPEPEGIIARHPNFNLAEWPQLQREYVKQHPRVYDGRIFRNESTNLLYFVDSNKPRAKKEAGQLPPGEKVARQLPRGTQIANKTDDVDATNRITEPLPQKNVAISPANFDEPWNLRLIVPKCEQQALVE